MAAERSEIHEEALRVEKGQKVSSEWVGSSVVVEIAISEIEHQVLATSQFSPLKGPKSNRFTKEQPTGNALQKKHYNWPTLPYLLLYSTHEKKQGNYDLWVSNNPSRAFNIRAVAPHTRYAP